MIKDQQIMRAVSGILQRSERQQDLQKLVGSFVDIGVLSQLENLNNQIIYGRRGTGKTHVLRVLESNLNKEKHNAVVYIDARTLGSTSQFSDPTVALKQRCLCLFRDVLIEIYNALLNQIINEPTKMAKAALESLEELNKVMTEPVSRYAEEAVTSKKLNKKTSGSSIDLSLNYKEGPSFSAKKAIDAAQEEEKTISYHVAHEDKVIFPTLHNLLRDILDKSQATLYILLDEWSSIPIDVQPYLAEFFKRAFLPNSKVVVKLAALEYRSCFVKRLSAGQILGFELGSDISTGLDIDDYYVYDRNAESVTETFADILHRHLRSELPDKYFITKYGIYSGTNLISRMFSNKSSFEELVRASEGVVRDLINIFSAAYFATQRRAKETIEKKTILEAARQWFEQDKAKNLDDELREALKRIVEEVIGHRRSRSFLLPRELETHSIIQRLFDLRVLHLMQRGYTDKNNPGLHYNIYSLDYGTYVGLLNTNRQPDLNFKKVVGEVPDDFIVPFDDKRSIRRIVLSDNILNSKNKFC